LDPLIKKCRSSRTSPPPSTGGRDEERTDCSIQVSWEDCAFAGTVHQRVGAGVVLEYTVELLPETEASIKSYQYYRCLFSHLLVHLGFFFKGTMS
jgi:hypothetical protein